VPFSFGRHVYAPGVGDEGLLNYVVSFGLGVSDGFPTFPRPAVLTRLPVSILMVKLDSYSKLTQESDDLLSKAFIISTLFGVTVKSKTQRGLNLGNKFKLLK
jgi:hypothetical protein